MQRRNKRAFGMRNTISDPSDFAHHVHMQEQDPEEQLPRRPRTWEGSAETCWVPSFSTPSEGEKDRQNNLDVLLDAALLGGVSTDATQGTGGAAAVAASHAAIAVGAPVMVPTVGAGPDGPGQPVEEHMAEGAVSGASAGGFFSAMAAFPKYAFQSAFGQPRAVQGDAHSDATVIGVDPTRAGRCEDPEQHDDEADGYDDEDDPADGAPPGAKPRGGLHRPCSCCRAAKVRCDRNMPCSRCVRLGTECKPPPTVPRGRPSHHSRLLQLRAHAEAQAQAARDQAEAETQAKAEMAAAARTAERVTAAASQVLAASKSCLASSSLATASTTPQSAGRPKDAHAISSSETSTTTAASTATTTAATTAAGATRNQHSSGGATVVTRPPHAAAHPAPQAPQAPMPAPMPAPQAPAPPAPMPAPPDSRTQAAAVSAAAAQESQSLAAAHPVVSQAFSQALAHGDGRSVAPASVFNVVPYALAQPLPMCQYNLISIPAEHANPMEPPPSHQGGSGGIAVALPDLSDAQQAGMAAATGAGSGGAAPMVPPEVARQVEALREQLRRLGVQPCV